MTHRPSWLIPVAAASALVACREAPRCPSDWCGTLVSAAAEPDVLFPPSTQFDVGYWIRELVFSQLASIGPGMATVGDSGFIPQLAQRWTWEGPTELRFSLNPKARWHDGLPVTARDVAFTFEVYRDRLVNSPARPLLEHIASVTAVDSLTAVFRFRLPYSEAFFDAVYQMHILPAHWLDTVPRARLASHPFGRHPVGSGPFRFVSWKAGESIELEGDSTYFLGRPGLRRVIWRVVPNMATLATQLAAGETDIGWLLAAPEIIQQLRAAPHLRLVPYPTTVYSYIGFNFRDPQNLSQPHPLFGDPELRRALSMAVDRPAVVRAILGELGEVPSGPVTRRLWVWSDSLRPPPFDTAAARRALDGLGWRPGTGGVLEKNGRRLEFDLLVPTASSLRRSSAVIVQEQLKQVGAAVRITELDGQTLLARAAAGRFDAAYLSFSQDPSPRSIQQTWSSSGIGGSNYLHYRNPTVDRLITAATAETDRARSLALWRQAIEQIDADAPAIWVYIPAAVVGVHQRLEDVALRSDIWTAWLWTWRVRDDALIPRDLVVVP